MLSRQTGSQAGKTMYIHRNTGLLCTCRYPGSVCWDGTQAGGLKQWTHTENTSLFLNSPLQNRNQRSWKKRWVSGQERENHQWAWSTCAAWEQKDAPERTGWVKGYSSPWKSPASMAELEQFQQETQCHWTMYKPQSKVSSY